MGRALVREPKVFLLDEPLSNLDAKLRVQMRAELKRIHVRLGITTIYVTHDQVEAMTLGDRIAVMSDGRIQQLGPPQDVYDRPANLFVAGFIGSPPMNLLRATARGGRIEAGDLVFDRPNTADGDLVIGVRPESLQQASDGLAGLDFVIEVVEPLGDEVIVHGTVAATVAESGAEEDTGLPVTARDRAEVLARLDSRQRPRAGETLRLGVDPDEVLLFDAETGAALR
jgi:multiple sugar transport system ATP-binding protein